MPKVGEVKSAWIKQRIEIIAHIDKGDQKRLVEAQCYNHLAVHLTIDNNHWAVTSTTTGCQATRVKTEIDAKRIAEYLWIKCCLAFRQKVWEHLIGKLPLWVKPWLLACRASERWVDPIPYQSGTGE